MFLCVPVIIGQTADHGLRFLGGIHFDQERSTCNAQKRDDSSLVTHGYAASPVTLLSIA